VSLDRIHAAGVSTTAAWKGGGDGTGAVASCEAVGTGEPHAPQNRCVSAFSL
jgi:hypothetical protein